MGRKSGSLYINPKKFGGGTQQKACMKEMTAFLNCLALNKNNDEKCLKQVEILNSCVDELKTKPKSHGEHQFPSAAAQPAQVVKLPLL